MKILKCHVAAFGKLKNYTVDFFDGFNQINQNNGWGKTTLCNFIAAIFYGLDNGRKSVNDSERKKYKPWNTTEKFGGFVEFSWKEYSYRLERYFGNKESDDQVIMTDLKTGKAVSKTENLGERIFGIDKEGFSSSTYFSQKSLEVKINSGITAKLNSVLNVEDAVAFDNAVAKLEKKSKQYKMQGSKGLISELQNKIYSVNDDIERAKRAEETLSIVKSDAEEINKKILLVNDRIKKYTLELENASKAEAERLKKERFFELKSEADKLKEEIEALEKKLNGHVLENEEIELYKKLYKEFIATNERINVLRQTQKELNFSITKDAPPKRLKNTIFPLAICFVFALLGIIGFFVGFGTVLSCAFIGVGVLGVLLILFLYLKNGSRKNDSAILEMAEKNKNDIISEEAKFNEYVDKLTAFAGKFNIEYNDYNSFLSELGGIKEKMPLLNARYKEKVNALSVYKNDITADKSNYNGISLEEIKINLEQARKDYKNLNESLSDKKVSILRLSETAQNLVDLENKKTELTEKLSEANEEYKIVVKTLEILKKADENLKAKFREPLENSFKKYMAEIDESFSALPELDSDMTVKIRENLGSFETAFYSEGYKALFEICKRFSLIDVLFDKEKPFIILDDPFVNLDKDKIDGALNAIKSLSKNYQIIYFTCHQSRCINER